ncbi:uncharacterized protein LOC121835312 [Ixodes scapularis]|uniref:uncharacterized protein LOC121835312 n=1 Tax=Ixodes scapularis TaxID=6945 RepID=UPI001C381D0F|nr:uncharacterized protein LOC121835312 [Ixodes scapularis]
MRISFFLSLSLPLILSWHFLFLMSLYFLGYLFTISSSFIDVMNVYVFMSFSLYLFSLLFCIFLCNAFSLLYLTISFLFK